MSSHVDRNYDHLFKLLLCGDSGVGKTCLISQFTDQQIRRSHITTIGIDFKLKTVTVGDKRIRLQIWDTAGQERFETLTAQYYRRAQGIMLVYDITQEQTFSNVTKWMRNIEENAVDDVKMIIVGNKVDLENERQVPRKRGEKLAGQHKVKFFETSAWTNVCIEDAFSSLTESILHGLEGKISVEHAHGSTIDLHSHKSEHSTASGGGGGNNGWSCCGSS